jgi:hypothetical protein
MVAKTPRNISRLQNLFKCIKIKLEVGGKGREMAQTMNAHVNK